jgi:hypothetical protein
MMLNSKKLSIILGFSALSSVVAQENMTSAKDCKLASISFKSLQYAWERSKKVNGVYEFVIDGFTVQMSDNTYNNMRKMFSSDDTYQKEPFFELAGEIQRGRCVYYPFVNLSKSTPVFTRPSENNNNNTQGMFVPYNQDFVFGFSFKKQPITQVEMKSIDDCKLKTISPNELALIFDKRERMGGVFEFVLNGFTVQMSENSVAKIEDMLQPKHGFRFKPIYKLADTIQRGRCVYRYVDVFPFKENYEDEKNVIYKEEYNFGLSFKD